MYHKSTNKKKTRVTVVISNRAKKIAREREEYYILLKGSIHQEYIQILNVYVANQIFGYMKQK